MLSLWILAAAAVAQDAGAKPLESPEFADVKYCSQGDVALVDSPCAPRLQDHRYAWSVRPQNTVLTTKWQCEGAAKPSAATIRVTERDFVREGRLTKNYAFDVELVSVVVEGEPASKATMERVRKVLEPLNTISSFAGRCRYAGPSGEEPLLSIFGFGLDDRERKEAEVRLLDTPPPMPPVKADGIRPDLRLVFSCQAPPGPAVEAVVEETLYAEGFDVLNTLKFSEAIDQHSAHRIRIEAVDDRGHLVWVSAPIGPPHRLFIALISRSPRVPDAQLESRIESLAADIEPRGCELAKKARHDNPPSQAWVFDDLAWMTRYRLNEAQDKAPTSGAFRVH